MSRIVVFSLLLFGVCDVIYRSPRVPSNDDLVNVVPLTDEVTRSANSLPYTPRQLPAVFYQGAGSGTSARGFGPTPRPSPTPQGKPVAPVTRLPPALADTPYRIGVRDVLLLATKSGDEANLHQGGGQSAQDRRQRYTVQQDGAIAVPDLGRIQVAGMTPEEVEAGLFDKLVRNQIEPSFSLEITGFNSQKNLGRRCGQHAVPGVDWADATDPERSTSKGGRDQ